MKFSDAEIKALAKVLQEESLTSIKYESGDEKITLSKGGSVTPLSTEHIPVTEVNAAPTEDQLSTVQCPLIGHFYLTPSPSEPEYIKVGDKIECGDVIGILQAMKVSNEIKSDISGEVVEILVDNGQFVDFDAPLIKVRP